MRYAMQPQERPMPVPTAQSASPVQQQEWAQSGIIERYTTVDGVIPVETAKCMIQMAMKDIQDPNVAGAARWIVRDVVDENVSPFVAILSEAQAIYNWVDQYLRYTRDPVGVELVYSAARVLDFIGKYGRWSEDCDSQALLILTFFLAIGRQARLTIAGFSHPGIYTHVFCEVFLPGIPGQVPSRWVAVDPSTGRNVGKMSQGIKTALSFYADGKIEPFNAG